MLVREMEFKAKGVKSDPPKPTAFPFQPPQSRAKCIGCPVAVQLQMTENLTNTDLHVVCLMWQEVQTLEVYD